MTICAVVKWNCAVVKRELCSCSCKFWTGTMEKCGKGVEKTVEKCEKVGCAVVLGAFGLKNIRKGWND